MYFKPYRIELYELIPESMYRDLYPRYQDRLWSIFPIQGLVTLDRLRKKYGPMYLNNWYWGGQHQYRGWRPTQCTVGSVLSQHKFSNAFDVVFKNLGAEEIRDRVLLNPDAEEFMYISCIEKDVSWFHMDFRQTMSMESDIWEGNSMFFFKRHPGLPF